MTASAVVVSLATDAVMALAKGFLVCVGLL